MLEIIKERVATFNRALNEIPEVKYVGDPIFKTSRDCGPTRRCKDRLREIQEQRELRNFNQDRYSI